MITGYKQKKGAHHHRRSLPGWWAPLLKWLAIIRRAGRHWPVFLGYSSACSVPTHSDCWRTKCWHRQNTRLYPAWILECTKWMHHTGPLRGIGAQPCRLL